MVLRNANADYSLPFVDNGHLYWCTVWASSGYNRAPIARLANDYAAFEGDTVTFDASGSSDLERVPLTYRWDLDGDGIWDEPRTNSPVAQHFYANNGAPEFVKVEVFDGELASVAQALVKIQNVPPRIQPGTNTALWGITSLDDTLTIVDPGADTWGLQIDFGDASRVETSTQTSRTVAIHHDYAKPGVYELRLRVSDGEVQTEARVRVAAGLPRLQIERWADAVRLSWANHPAVPIPLRTSGVAGTPWELLPEQSTLESDRRFLVVPASAPSAFFKLSWP